jgi:hypothetical protein
VVVQVFVRGKEVVASEGAGATRGFGDVATKDKLDQPSEVVSVLVDGRVGFV